jgi:hypothetical protein
MGFAVAIGEATGWLIAGLIPITVTLPYLLRGRLLAAGGWTMPYLERMRPHYWIGVTIAGLSFIHAGFAMSGRLPAGTGYATGLWVATGGMLLAGGQAYIGMKMRALRGAERLRLRKTHFRVMLGLVAAGVIHIVLNGAVVRSLVGS